MHLHASAEPERMVATAKRTTPEGFMLVLVVVVDFQVELTRITISVVEDSCYISE